MSALPHAIERYTYKDYLEFPEDFRCELIDGIVCDMGAPRRYHQALSHRLASDVERFFRNHECRSYPAPFDVLLPEAGESEMDSTNVVQPDLVVYCDRSKLTDAGATGAPDLVVEILSPSTKDRDLLVKLGLYERHGVREYWIVDGDSQILLQFARNEQGKLDREAAAKPPAEVRSVLFPELSIDLQELFASE